MHTLVIWGFVLAVAPLMLGIISELLNQSRATALRQAQVRRATSQETT